MKNIILLTIDALRRDVLGTYDCLRGLTPFLDRLGEKSVRFSRAYATGPYTQAAFPGLLTSGYYLDYGLAQGLDPQRTVVAEPLQKVGISTAAFHSNPYLCDYFGWNRGWETFFDAMEEDVDDFVPYADGERVNQEVAGWLEMRSHSGDRRPFFMWVHYMDIHEPYLPPAAYLERTAPELNPTPEEMFGLFRDVLLPRRAVDGETGLLLRKLYEAQVRQVDDHVRDLFGLLGQHGLAENLTVIVTSDHGDEFGEHGGLSHDDKMFEELVHIPLMIYDSDRDAPEVSERLVSGVDVPPTILHMCGLAPHDNFQGSSMLRADAPQRGCFGEAVAQHGESGGDEEMDIYYYRVDRFKLIHRPALEEWLLFDLQDDPEERRNIFSSSPEADRLKAALMPRIRRWRRS